MAQKLWEYAAEAGLCTATGNGLAPLSFQEIEAWVRLTALPLDHNTALAIRSISSAYVSQSADRAKVSTAPWPEQQAEVQDLGGKVREALSGLKRRKVKRSKA